MSTNRGGPVRAIELVVIIDLILASALLRTDLVDEVRSECPHPVAAGVVLHLG